MATPNVVHAAAPILPVIAAVEPAVTVPAVNVVPAAHAVNFLHDAATIVPLLVDAIAAGDAIIVPADDAAAGFDAGAGSSGGSK